MRTPCHIRTRVPRLLAWLERKLLAGRVPPLPRWATRLPGSFPIE